MRRSGALVAAGMLVATACGGGARGNAPPLVVATVYPLAEIAREVGGDAVEVVELVPPGVEPHDVELTARDLVLLEEAAVILYLGGGFQPAVEEAIPDDARAIDLLASVSEARDPHIWLAPTKMAEIVRPIAAGIADALGFDRAPFFERAGTYLRSLEQLHEEYRRTLTGCERRVFVTSHDAFGHLARRYSLQQLAIAGLSPEGEPTPARLDELRRLVAEAGITTIFAETLVSPRVAETLAREADVTVEVLDPLENLTAEQRATGASYVSVMQDNLAKLANALGCGTP